jgi:hypothetical protein
LRIMNAISGTPETGGRPSSFEGRAGKASGVEAHAARGRLRMTAGFRPITLNQAIEKIFRR